MTQPNILIILTDQQHADMLSCAGNRWLSTPHTDALAAEAVRFERAYAANPVCVPSRFSLMTGRYPSAIGLQWNVPDDAGKAAAARCYQQALGWCLRDAGYDTVYAGKQHLPGGTAEQCGFRVLSTDEREACARESARFLQESHDKPFALVTSLINPHDICYMAIRDAIGTPYETPAARGLIERGKAEIAALDDALRLPEGVTEQRFYDELCPPLPANHEPQRDEPAAILEHIRGTFKQHAREHYDERRWRLHRWAYARLTERVDREIGIVFDALRASGRDRDTLVIFTSDHGDHDASHRLEHKTIPYDEAIRVPLIVRPPGGLDAPRVDRTHLVSNGLDLLPSVCAWANASPPRDLTGLSVRGLVEDGAGGGAGGRAGGGAWRDSVLVESVVADTVITASHQYSLYHDGENREQLYDLDRDPGQTRNHASDPALAGVLAEHRRLLAEHVPSAAPTP